jgi:O-antigen/teichoic acid export membrane protein
MFNDTKELRSLISARHFAGEEPVRHHQEQGGCLALPADTPQAQSPSITQKPRLGKLWLNRYRRLFSLTRLFGGYSFGQAVAQGLGFLAGIMVVRILPKEDYAWFMIVNTIGPVMNMLSDNGVTNSLSAIGGRFWQDDARMGSLVRTAMVLRRQLVLFSSLAVTPVLVWMLWHNHASPAIIAWLVPLTLVGVFFQLNTGVLSVVVRLRQQVGRMQLLAFSGVLPRLALIALLAALGLLNAPLAVAAGTVAFAAQFWLLERWVKPQITWNAPPNQEFRKDIVSIAKRQAPLTIYFCLQSQIGIWLISIFGNVQHVAEVGAVGRIGMIFSILISTTSALVVPRFARCQDPARLRSRYAQILMGFAGIVGLGTLFSWCLPAPLLWLLGPKYYQLGGLVWLAVLATGTGSLAGLLYSLNINKGWIPPARIVIPAEILTQLILCLIFDLSTVRGILLIGLLAPIVPSLINLFVGAMKLGSLAHAASETTRI